MRQVLRSPLYCHILRGPSRILRPRKKVHCQLLMTFGDFIRLSYHLLPVELTRLLLCVCWFPGTSPSLRVPPQDTPGTGLLSW